MPHITLEVGAVGPVMPVGIGLSDSMRSTALRVGLAPAMIQRATALVDTGAFMSAVDQEVLNRLGLSPISMKTVRTPSTFNQPTVMFVYDVSIWLSDSRTQYVLDRSFPVIAAPLGRQGIDVLLGRDVLGESLLVYDSPGRRFTLAF